MQHDVDREAATHDVLADVARGVGLVQRGGHTLLGHGHFSADVEEALRQSGGVTRDQTSFDELMRIALHEQAVLVGTGLALVAVDHEIPRPLALRGETPLGPGRETRSAATEHRGVLDFVVNVGGRATERLLQTLIATGREITLESERVVVLES